jgi:cytochrome c
MDSFEFNKIALVFLGSVFVLFALSILSDSLFHAEAPETPGYEIVAAEGTEGTGTETASGPAYEPIEALLASADIGAGETVFKKCASCHTADKGGANKVGPNLWNVVGGPIYGHHPEFNYSAAIKAYGEGKNWTYEELNGFLFKPKAHIKGTAMGFAGLPKTQDRVNLIGWLRTQSDAPIALPGS